ncbi:MAG TPA: 4Fe-4S binding protein [Thermoplasmata archaeon]|jgi:pyruvate ferredoxin oxidoreductase delta subunit
MTTHEIHHPYETEEDLPEAPIAYEPSDVIKTASWRTFRPVIHLVKCTKCNVCWKFCPDNAIGFDGDGFPVIRLDYCKGCAICAEECKPRAIEMVKEED